MGTNDEGKKVIIDLTELAKALIDVEVQKDRKLEVIIPKAKITSWGKGGAHITIPNKYLNQEARVEIYKELNISKRDAERKFEK